MPFPALAAGGLWAFLKTFLLHITISLIARILLSFGVAIYTKKAVADKCNEYLDKAASSIATSDYTPYLSMLGADDCLSIITAAISFRAAMAALELIFVRK